METLKELNNKYKYNELLFKSGRNVLNTKLFIDNLENTGLFPENNIQNIKKYLTKELLTDEALDILDEYIQQVL